MNMMEAMDIYYFQHKRHLRDINSMVVNASSNEDDLIDMNDDIIIQKE